MKNVLSHERMKDHIHPRIYTFYTKKAYVCVLYRDDVHLKIFAFFMPLDFPLTHIHFESFFHSKDEMKVKSIRIVFQIINLWAPSQVFMLSSKKIEAKEGKKV